MMKRNYVIILWVLLMMVTALACTQQEPPLQQPEAEGPVNDYEGIIRFHVIANSDSAEDQDLKLLVRNCVIVKLQNALQGAEDVAATRKYIEENTEEINSWAQSCINAWGYDYKTETNLGIAAIPAKQYDDVYFPAGNYEALTITIGEGKGQNWWCVIFPPLCLVDCSEEPYSQLFEEEKGRLVLKSKLLEILGSETEQKAKKKANPEH